MSNWTLSCLAFFLFPLMIQLHTCNKAHGYPQNVRHGYPQCQSCHLSPTGGGVLTNYGRGMADELATFSYEGEGRLGHYFEQPDWLLFGGDVRWVNHTSKSVYAERSRIFFMQTDLEAAISPIQNLWLVGTIGKYAEGDKYEYRRNYVLITIGDKLSFRVGKFFPTLGLNLPDHRSFVHPGQGAETYNAEAAYSGQFFSLSASAVGQRQQTIKATDKEGYKLDGSPRPAASGSVFVGNVRLGAFVHSGQSATTRGTFIAAGYGDAYLLLQLQKHSLDSVFFSEAGYQLIRGLDLFGRFQTEPNTQEFAAGLNFFPRPHWQLLLELGRAAAEGIYTDSLLFMGHYNL